MQAFRVTVPWDPSVPATTCEFGSPDLRVDVPDGATYSESACSLAQVSDDERDSGSIEETEEDLGETK